MQNCQQSANKQRRRETVGEASRGASYQRRASAAGLRIGGPASDADGDECFYDPGKKPGDRRSLSGGDGRGAQGGNAHGHPTPSWNGGERCGTFHGFTNETQIVASMIVDGNRRGGPTKRFRQGHDHSLAAPWQPVKYFVLQSITRDRTRRRKIPWLAPPTRPDYAASELIRGSWR